MSTEQVIDANNELIWVKIRDESEAMSKDERFFVKFRSKALDNPLVPIGLAATTFCLCYGILSLSRGDHRMQQHMMRGRVLAQGFTIVAIVGGIATSIKSKVDERIANAKQ